MINVIDLTKIKPVLFNTNDLDFISYDENLFLQKIKDEGISFISDIDGMFGLVLRDTELNKLYLVRDWIGEVPLHYLMVDNKLYIANFIEDFLEVEAYNYGNVFAVNRSEYVTVDLETGKCEKELYYNFNNDSKPDYSNLEIVASEFHDRLFDSVKDRVKSLTGNKALLLSGGIDSMSIAYIAGKINPDIPVYTIDVASQQSTDLIRAKEITKEFNLKHKIVDVSKEDIVNVLEESVLSSEIFHMYNVFCAVGMHKLSEVLKSDNILNVFTGEGGNEIFGDYHDWIIKDSFTKEPVLLQKTDNIFNEPVGREAYLWGNLEAEKKGYYNKQLGSGLGKHGGSRMYKPLFKKGLNLISPYLRKDVCKIGANVPYEILNDMGGKAGFMKMVFKKEIQDGEIPEKFFNIKKIRLQDASEGGELGITETLIGKGYNQSKIIDIYNKLFRANIKELSHLSNTILIK